MGLVLQGGGAGESGGPRIDVGDNQVNEVMGKG
jgi:hypothetical protein